MTMVVPTGGKRIYKKYSRFDKLIFILTSSSSLQFTETIENLRSILTQHGIEFITITRYQLDPDLEINREQFDTAANPQFSSTSATIISCSSIIEVIGSKNEAEL